MAIGRKRVRGDARLAYDVVRFNATPSTERDDRFEGLDEELDAADRKRTARSRELEEKINRYFEDWLQTADNTEGGEPRDE